MGGVRTFFATGLELAMDEKGWADRSWFEAALTVVKLVQFGTSEFGSFQGCVGCLLPPASHLLCSSLLAAS